MTTITPAAITAEGLAALLAEGSPTVLLDVRSPAEFESAHIPGAVNVPVDVVTSQAARIAERASDPVVLICQAGPRAEKAGAALSAAGLDRAIVLQGGMAVWDDGFRTVSRGRATWSIDRQVRGVAGALVLAGIGASLRKPRARFFAGAIGAGLTFSAVSDFCLMGELLAKLPYNRGGDFDAERAISQL